MVRARTAPSSVNHRVLHGIAMSQQKKYARKKFAGEEEEEKKERRKEGKKERCYFKNVHDCAFVDSGAYRMNAMERTNERWM